MPKNLAKLVELCAAESYDWRDIDMKKIKWRCASMHDRSGRRGIWFRSMPDGDLQIRAGREGGDNVAVLSVKEVPGRIIAAVRGCLEVGAWMQEDEGPDTKMEVLGDFSMLLAQAGFNSDGTCPKGEVPFIEILGSNMRTGNP